MVRRRLAAELPSDRASLPEINVHNEPLHYTRPIVTASAPVEYQVPVIEVSVHPTAPFVIRRPRPWMGGGEGYAPWISSTTIVMTITDPSAHHHGHHGHQTTTTIDHTVISLSRSLWQAIRLSRTCADLAIRAARRVAVRRAQEVVSYAVRVSARAARSVTCFVDRLLRSMRLQLSRREKFGTPAWITLGIREDRGTSTTSLTRERCPASRGASSSPTRPRASALNRWSGAVAERASARM